MKPAFRVISSGNDITAQISHRLTAFGARVFHGDIRPHFQQGFKKPEPQGVGPDIPQGDVGPFGDQGGNSQKRRR